MNATTIDHNKNKSELSNNPNFFPGSFLSLQDVNNPMDKSLTEVFVTLSMLTDEQAAEFTEEFRATPLSRILTHRIEFGLANMEGVNAELMDVMDYKALALVCCLVDQEGSPGAAVLWACTVLHAYALHGTVTFVRVSMQLFPMGFPTKEQTTEVWDSQKGHFMGLEGVDNWLDTPEPWVEIGQMISNNIEHGAPKNE